MNTEGGNPRFGPQGELKYGTDTENEELTLPPQRPHHQQQFIPKYDRWAWVAVNYALFTSYTQYVVVMPSLFLYLKEMDESTTELLFGLTMCAFPLATVLSAPLFGYLLDRFGRQTKKNGI